MAKNKRGRPRGRGPGGGGFGGQGGMNGGGGHHRHRGRKPGYRPRVPRDQMPPPEGEPAENGEAGPLEPASGILELHPNGYGFLRDPKNNYSRERTDPFVPGTMIEKFH